MFNYDFYKITTKLLLRCVLMTSFLGVTLQTNAQPLDINDPKILEAYFDGAIKSAMNTANSPSGVVTLMKDDKIIFAKGYGYSDVATKTLVDPKTTLFRPGSISKLFTWVSVMQLVEQKKLNLDTDVNQYLQSFKVKDTWPGNPVTLRHIMTHTAGFEDTAIGHLIIQDESRIVPLAQALEAYQPQRVNPPGEHVAYSNWATALAGLIVSEVSGLDFNDYVKTHIFNVLDMNYSTFVEPLPASLVDFHARAYSYSQGQFVEESYELVTNFSPAGSAAMSAYDIAKFARALLNNGEFDNKRILKSDTVKQMLTEGFSHDDRVRGMGLGFIKYRYGADNLSIFGHDGATTAFLSHLGMSKSENLMLFTSFSGKPLPGAVHKSVVKGFYDEFFPHNTEQTFIQSDNLIKYAGTFNSWRSNFTQAESLVRLTSSLKVTALEDALLINGKRYKEVDNNLFEEVDGYGRLAFQQDESGSIDGFVNDGFGVQQFYRSAYYETADFNVLMICLVVIIFIAVLARLGYQWSTFKHYDGADKAASIAAISGAVFNLMFFIFLFLTISNGIDDLVFEIPTNFKIALSFALLATIAGLAQLLFTVKVWQQSLFKNTLARVRYTFVTVGALFMIWFYYYWNLIGFNYFN